MTDHGLIGQQEEKATFIVQIQYQQNATWQGTVRWVDQKRTRHFRSTLELIKLLDDAITPEEDIKTHFDKWQKTDK